MTGCYDQLLLPMEYHSLCNVRLNTNNIKYIQLITQKQTVQIPGVLWLDQQVLLPEHDIVAWLPFWMHVLREKLFHAAEGQHPRNLVSWAVYLFLWVHIVESANAARFSTLLTTFAAGFR